MRKAILVLAVLLSPAIAFSQSGVPPKSATDLTNAEIQAIVKNALQGNVTDQILRLVDTGKNNVGVALVRRPAGGAGGNALSHDRITEVYYILRGSGVQTTGGTLVDAKQTPENPVIGPSMSGSNLQNARSSNLGPGDLQIIPPGVPHMWSSINAGGIDYLVLRVDPDHVLSVR